MAYFETGRRGLAEMASELEVVVKELRRELALLQLDRSSHASTQSLESAISSYLSAIEALRVGRAERAVEILDTISRGALDEWELASPLTAAVVSCAQALRGQRGKRSPDGSR